MVVHVLVVDDDEKLPQVIKAALSADGFKVGWAPSAEAALEEIQRRPLDLLILDWKLPDRSGVSLCRLLRNDPKTAGIPILMLTGVKGVKEKVDALELGADDYLTKPFQISELRARIRAVLRRKTPWLVQARTLEFKDLKLDPANFKAFVRKKDVGLTKTEFEILYLLAASAGHIVQRNYLESRTLDMDYPTASRPLDVHLSRIRAKLGPKVGRRIETARGLGYIFAAGKGHEYPH